MNQSAVKRTIFDSIMGAYFFCVILVVLFNVDSEQMLLLGRNVQMFFIGAIGAGLLSYMLNHLNIKTLGELIFEPAYKKAQQVHAKSNWRQLWYWQLIAFLVITFAVGFNVTQFSIQDLFDKSSLEGVGRILIKLFTPNFEILPKAVSSMIVTLFMSFLATALAIPIAFVLSFLSAKNVMNSPLTFGIYTLLRSLFNFVRSIEALVWAIIFSVWVGIGPFAGMLALMVHSVASLAKQYSEIIETVSEGPIEGILSTGANKLQVIWFAIVPQVILPFISFTIYRWDINIRMATIIGLVGGGGIGTMLYHYQGQSMWNEVGMIVFVIAFVVWFMDTASAYLREALK